MMDLFLGKLPEEKRELSERHPFLQSKKGNQGAPE